ncbi:MAG TPA: hypothetical protein PLH86_12170, partial [Saprospiraceae bacterium]|nr:hypothetical protein [Saprospiraceae bacterium]
MKRRSFLKASSLATVPVLINGIPVEAIAKSTFANFVNPEDDRILVVIQLRIYKICKCRLGKFC